MIKDENGQDEKKYKDIDNLLKDRPAWRNPSVGESVSGHDSEGKEVHGRMYSVVVFVPIDALGADAPLERKIHGEMVKAIGHCLAEAGKISFDDIG